MGTIRSGVGLISGLDSSNIIQQLLTLQRLPVVRLEQRAAALQGTSTALKTLEANLLTLATSIQTLGNKETFSKLSVANNDVTQLAATATDSAVPGTYQFQTLRKASAFQSLSRGFANADAQAVGTGTITIQNGGHLSSPTALDSLNGGSGIRRGTIRITDRSGATAEVDLSEAYSVADVVEAINGASEISVTASTRGGALVLNDTSGANANDLSVTDINGGAAAIDLGIAKSVASSTLTGDDVYLLTGEFTLDQINDGNGLRQLNGAPDLRITTADASTFDVDFDDAFSLNDVLSAINDHEDNTGLVSAALVDGHLELTDLSGGSATAFVIEDINSASVIEPLGIGAAAVGNTITGRNLLAGIDSVLLANLRGGQGIGEVGQVSFTDRTGSSATIDFAGVDSLDEVLAAINDSGLQLTARINDVGTGIEIVDTSGSTASNLVIADIGTGTLATDLGIAINDADDSINSGALNLRYRNESASLANYTADGSDITPGQIRIVDSAGNSDLIDISSAVDDIGDVIQRINSADNIQVTAALNDTGDGFVLIDEAAGAGTLSVEEVDSDTAADLRILGDGVVGSDGKQRISSRFATVVDVEAGETLNDVVNKINQATGYASASVFNDGSAFNAHRLLIAANENGRAGRLAIHESGLDFTFGTASEAQDGLLRVGLGAAGFVVSSSSDNYPGAATGIDIVANTVSTTPATVTVSRDDKNIESALKAFVDGFNTFIEAAAEQTKFDVETNERGLLQGQNVVLRAETRLQNLAVRRFNGFGELNSLLDLGIRATADGTLEFDSEKFNAALQADRGAVEDFLSRDEDGFSAVADELLDSLTDTVDGSFALEANSLQTSIDLLGDRISLMEELLIGEQDRLIREFAFLENTLGDLQFQQQALAGISTLSISPVGTGIF